MMGFFRRSPSDEPAVRQEPVVTERATTIPKTGTGRASLLKMARSMSVAAARRDRLTANWPTTPVPADDIVRRHQRPLVARSRDQAINNDYGRAFKRMVRQNLVGPNGIRLQAQAKDDRGKLDKDANTALENAFWDWGRRANCDVTGKRSWRAIQALAAVTVAIDGEFFIRMVYGADAGPWGFALQVLDPQRCPVDFDADRIAGGGFIRSGIEFNDYGRPRAYYFSTTRESEADYFYGGRAYIRIAADEIIHGYVEDMAGQKRGLPWMVSALLRMHMLGGYENSALVNARVSAAKGGFFQWKEGYGPDDDEDDADIEMDVEPGMYRELPSGLEVKDSFPQYPTGELGPFRKEMLRAIASGLGVSYNSLANDLEGVNFSSIRQGALDEREYWKDLQEWFWENLHEVVYERWLQVALLSGRIVLPEGGKLRPERIAKYRDVSWQGRRWTWIDPAADVKAAIDSKNNGLSTFSQFIRDSGRDPQEVYRELADDIEQMRDANLPEWFIEQALGKKPAAPKAPVPGQQNGDDPPPEGQA